MLTGRPPFRAETAAETERQILAEEPVPPRRLNSKVPADLQTICLKAIEKQTHRRYATAVELAADLERYSRGEPIRARPVSWLEIGWRWSKRNQAIATAIASLALLLTVSVFGSVWAAVHFRTLATIKSKLAQTNEDKRLAAESAVFRETQLRSQAEDLSSEIRHSLYLTEMNLAGQSAMLSNGLDRTR
ncbi:MAG: hypothetical protein JWP89_4924 [Schlesneria sp.]|nr:hypothetical protein [Schlesneria sp.]